jgi:predicted DCC family thiol-disulfide oxidoreductase YuxK
MSIKVYFNDSCNICRMEINHYKKIANSDLEWIDITNNDEAIKITSKSQKELLRRLHVINNGEVIGGAKAFIIIWSKIPKYKILSKIFSIKPLFIIFHYIYEIAAFFLFLKNRKQLNEKTKPTN